MVEGPVQLELVYPVLSPPPRTLWPFQAITLGITHTFPLSRCLSSYTLSLVLSLVMFCSSTRCLFLVFCLPLESFSQPSFSLTSLLPFSNRSPQLSIDTLHQHQSFMLRAVIELDVIGLSLTLAFPTLCFSFSAINFVSLGRATPPTRASAARLAARE